PYSTGVATLMTLRNSAGASVASLVQLANRRLAVRDDVSGGLYSSPTRLAPAQFQTLQLRARLQGGHTAVQAYRNGVRIGSLGINVANVLPFSSIQVGNGTPGRSFDVVFDDVNVTGT